MQLVGVASLTVLRPTALFERDALFHTRPADFEVFHQFEVGEARDFERLSLPDEVLSVEVDALRLDSEELALHRLELLRFIHFADNRTTLVARNDVVTWQKVILQVFVCKN